MNIRLQLEASKIIVRMHTTLSVYKPIGKTPLQVILQFKKQFPEYENVKMAYAGRLDPLAEGVLIILCGEECKNRKEYERLDKEYDFEILAGISTDSYDVMGLIQKIDFHQVSDSDFSKSIKNCINKFKGEFDQPYPPYSSIKVNGKSLFHWARENKLSSIKIPSKKVTVYSVEFLSEKQLSGKKLLESVKNRVENVEGVFRQKEIVVDWENKLALHLNQIIPVFKFRITCSSGTYIRSIANEVGKKIGIPCLANSIHRTRVGNFTILPGVKRRNEPELPIEVVRVKSDELPASKL